MSHASVNCCDLTIHHRHHHKFIYNFIVIFTVLICTRFIYCHASPVRSGQSTVTGKGSECPSNDHLVTLAFSAKRRSSHLLTDTNSINCFCSSDSHSSDGWEITCIDNAAPSVKRDKVNPFTATRVNGSSDAVKSSREDTSASPPPLYTLQTSPLAFTIKNDNGRSVEISCDSAVPDFKPAMLQGKCCGKWRESLHCHGCGRGREKKCKIYIHFLSVTGDCAGERECYIKRTLHVSSPPLVTLFLFILTHIHFLSSLPLSHVYRRILS